MATCLNLDCKTRLLGAVRDGKNVKGITAMLRVIWKDCHCGKLHLTRGYQQKTKGGHE